MERGRGSDPPGVGELVPGPSVPGGGDHADVRSSCPSVKLRGRVGTQGRVDVEQQLQTEETLPVCVCLVSVETEEETQVFTGQTLFSGHTITSWNVQSFILGSDWLRTSCDVINPAGEKPLF